MLKIHRFFKNLNKKMTCIFNMSDHLLYILVRTVYPVGSKQSIGILYAFFEFRYASSLSFLQNSLNRHSSHFGLRAVQK